MSDVMKKIIAVLLCLSFKTGFAVSPLAQDLDRFVKQYTENTPEQIQSLNRNAIKSLKNSGILAKAINVGDYAPPFNLPNAIGGRVSLYNELKKGPVVLVWYRGSWCPYCNLQLRHIQKQLFEITSAGAQVIAVSPELADKTMTAEQRHQLEFQVLSDINNRVADQYRLAYTVDDAVADHYNLAEKLNHYNGNNTNRLPLAVTYVINTNGLVEYAFLDADYKNRATPEEIISVLNAIKHQ